MKKRVIKKREVPFQKSIKATLKKRVVKKSELPNLDDESLVMMAMCYWSSVMIMVIVCLTSYAHIIFVEIRACLQG